MNSYIVRVYRSEREGMREGKRERRRERDRERERERIRGQSFFFFFEDGCRMDGRESSNILLLKVSSL